jgi:hypothetical protein
MRKKIYSCKKINIPLIKIAIYSSLSLHKGRPSYRRRFHPTKDIYHLWLQKMVGQKNFPPSSFGAVVGSGIRDPGSGMDKNQDPG